MSITVSYRFKDLNIGEDTRCMYDIVYVLVENTKMVRKTYKTDWMKLDASYSHTIPSHYIGSIVVYLIHNSNGYRYNFDYDCKHILGNENMEINIRDIEDNVMVRINNKTTTDIETLHVKSFYVFCCGCCNVKRGLDDLISAKADEECDLCTIM